MLPFTISFRFPFEITIIAPATEIIIPKTFIRFNFSLKKYAEKIVINIGLLAIIIAERPALINFSPLKKKTLYENTPVIPRRKTGIICPFLGKEGFPSTFNVNNIRKTEAMTNLKNAAEKGPTSCATILPAIKVPPQKNAVNINFI